MPLAWDRSIELNSASLLHLNTRTVKQKIFSSSQAEQVLTYGPVASIFRYTLFLQAHAVLQSTDMDLFSAVRTWKLIAVQVHLRVLDFFKSQLLDIIFICILLVSKLMCASYRRR